MCEDWWILTSIRSWGMDMALSKLNNGGWVHIFPEGSRSRDGGKMIGTTKRGVGSLARQGMKQIYISTTGTNLIGQDAKMAIKENMLMQITNASLLVKLYCAVWVMLPAAVYFMLNNWAGMDKVKAREYILKCQLILAII